MPPARRVTAASLDQLLQRLGDALARIPRVNAVNVPEVLDENHMGQPFYRTPDSRDFARAVRERIQRDVLVNKVVVHLPSRGAFVRWARSTLRDFGISNVVLVGGSSSLRRYPGPGVVEASGIVNHLYREMGAEHGLIGNITIPSRPQEAERMFTKTLSGCQFATSQILFDTTSLHAFLEAYSHMCREFEVPAATVIVSLAPISDIHDLEFVRWLGAEVPESVEERLFESGPEAAKRQSIQIALKVWKDTRELVRRKSLQVPLGVNVEQVSHHNLDAAVEMASRLSSTLD